MSVAEALGGELRVSSVERRRARFYPGLNLDHLETYESTAPANAPAEKSERWRSEGNNHSREQPNPTTAADILPKQEDKEIDRISSQRQNFNNDVGMFSDRMDNWGESKRSRDTDLFLDVLGGPGGTVLRQNGSPTLTDPRFTQQQQQFQQQQATGRSERLAAGGNRTKVDQIEGETNRQQRYGEDYRRQMTQETRRDDDPRQSNRYCSDFEADNRLQERRSLNLESSRGGAGAPVKDPWGKNVTRMPITLSRNNYGESKITEDIPGKATFDLDFTNEESKPYYPWGSQGGGAPIRDRDGNIITQIYGKLEGRNGMEGEMRRNKRRQEVLSNELREGMKQQKENKEELTRYMKAPQTEMADLLLAGRVGKPKRDEITGEIGGQHLSNSDVSKIKMNYQPVPATQKKMYYDELVRMAEERQYQKQLERLKERQESNAHFQNMDATWGNYGGGAPKHHVIRKKANLTNCLFYPDQSNESRQIGNDYMPPTGLGSFEYQAPVSSYEKHRAGEDNPLYLSTVNDPRYVKTTSRSSHKTLYDVTDQPQLAGTRGMPLAPYATGEMY